MKHQALIRILAIQKQSFGEAPRPKRAPGLQADHGGAFATIAENGDYLVEGSASDYPDYFVENRPWEGYFEHEQFRFNSEGKLIERSALKWTTE